MCFKFFGQTPKVKQYQIIPLSTFVSFFIVKEQIHYFNKWGKRSLVEHWRQSVVCIVHFTCQHFRGSGVLYSTVTIFRIQWSFFIRWPQITLMYTSVSPFTVNQECSNHRLQLSELPRLKSRLANFGSGKFEETGKDLTSPPCFRSCNVEWESK